MIPFKLIGGRWDGREGDGRWRQAPPQLFVIEDQKREDGGVVYARHRPGATVYHHAGKDYGFHIYIFTELTDEGWYYLSEIVQEPLAA